MFVITEINRIDGVIVKVLASSVTDRAPIGSNKKTNMYCVTVKHTALRSKTVWLGFSIMWASDTRYLSLGYYFNALSISIYIYFYMAVVVERSRALDIRLDE